MKYLSLAVPLLVVAFAAVAFGGNAAEEGGLYGRRIILDVKSNDPPAIAAKAGVPQAAAAAEELAGWLEKITGKKFDVAAPSAGDPQIAIFLLSASSPLVAQADRDRLKDKGLEAFVLQGDSHNLRIIANDWRGVTWGTYTYLEQLGVRWLMAGPNWTVVPKRVDITVVTDRLIAPAFFTRGYFGTGGFYSNTWGRRYTGSAASQATGISEFQIEWEKWSRHMRNGGPGLAHHMGEAFVSANEATLAKHPEYLAKIEGKYTPLYLPSKVPAFANYVWDATQAAYVKAPKPGTGTHQLNIIAKLNAGNPDAVALYSNWIMAGLRAQRNAPGGYAVQTISVSPSDGGGEGNNYDELKAQGIGDGSESDQEFYVANHIAQQARTEFPDVSGVILAYAKYSDPPTFPVGANVIVQPAFAFRYGKKTIGLRTDEWLALWKTRAETMAVYDYWSIPDWSHDEPTFNYLGIAKTLRRWYGSHIKGIQAESTFSGGAMGIGHYVASHLMWDVGLDEQALIEDWYDNAFGAAKMPMKRMLERWARGYKPISSELGAAYFDITEAEHLAAGNAAVMARVDDYARYLHYLRLRDEWLNERDASAKLRKAIEISEYLLDINDSRMVHTTRIVDLFRSQDVMAEFHLHNVQDPNNSPDGPGWARVRKLSHEDVAAMVADGASKYPPANFEVTSFTGELKPVRAIAWEMPVGDPWGAVMPVSSATADLKMPQGLASFRLRVSKTEGHKVSVTDDAGHTVYSHTVTGGGQDTWDEMSIPLAPGHYEVRLDANGGRLGLLKFQTWKGVPLTLRFFQNQKFGASPRLYFFVPKGSSTVAIYFPYTNRAGGFQTAFYYPDGAQATSNVQERDAGKLVVIAVPPGMDDKIWSLEKLIQPYENFQALSVPQAFSLSPETLMVPADALK